MKATKEQREMALQLAKKHNVDKIYLTKNGEYFTEENYAKLSVNGVTADYCKINVLEVSTVVPTPSQNKNNGKNGRNGKNSKNTPPDETPEESPEEISDESPEEISEESPEESDENPSN